jgi:cell cycle sensor histidine kinase DivJ
MVLFTAAGENIDALVHPSVVSDRTLFARHRNFIAAHLAFGILSFALMPLLMLLRSTPPSPMEFVILGWLAGPLVIALDLSRSGRLEHALRLSAFHLLSLIFLVAAVSGGVSSLALMSLPFALCAFSRNGDAQMLKHLAAATCGGSLALLGLHVMGVVPADAVSPVGLAIIIPLMMGSVVLYLASGLGREDAAGERHEAKAEDAFLNAYADDLVTRHTASGAVVFASASSRRILGVEGDDLLGRGLFERVHVADRPAFLTALSQARTGAGRPVEVRLRQAPAAEPSHPRFIWAEMRCSTLEPDTAGRKANAEPQTLVVTRDISEQKSREDNLRKACTEADNAEAAKGRFLANMSHELRTPLNAIIGFSELLVSNGIKGMPEMRRQEYASLIHESGLHLLSVVNGVLDLSRLESGNMTVTRELFALRPVVESCVNLFALKAAQSAVTVSVDVSEALPDVPADRRACKQILINLLSNAIKFTPQGGRISISARRVGQEMWIEVQDTGVGISAENLPKVGTSFFQVGSAYDRPYEGTGLGLSVVKGLVALHDGELKVESRLGQGTKVSVRLPLEGGEAVQESALSIEDVHVARRIAAHG